MRARELARPFPMVFPDTDASDAARAMAAERLPGLIVCGDDGRPYTVLPGSQVLRFLIPATSRTTPAWPGRSTSRPPTSCAARLEHRTVRDLLPRPQDLDELPVVDRDATALEVAAVMARMHSPLVAVVDGDAARSSARSRSAACWSYLLPPADGTG